LKLFHCDRPRLTFEARNKSNEKGGLLVEFIESISSFKFPILPIKASSSSLKESGLLCFWYSVKLDTYYILKYAYNFKDLYKDGIHPIDTLAKLWLRKLQPIVIEKCF
jgi:hypothetical protein